MLYAVIKIQFNWNLYCLYTYVARLFDWQQKSGKRKKIIKNAQNSNFEIGTNRKRRIHFEKKFWHGFLLILFHLKPNQ